MGKWSKWKFVFILFHVAQTWASFTEEAGVSDLFSPVLALCLSGQAQFEMPYVVRLHNFHQLSAPQPCFTFSHPNRGGFLCVCPLTWCVRARPPSFFSCCLGLPYLSFPWSCSLPSCLGLLFVTHTLFPDRSYGWQQPLLYLGVSRGGEYSTAWVCRLLWDCALSGHHSEWVWGSGRWGMSMYYLGSSCMCFI